MRLESGKKSVSLFRSEEMTLAQLFLQSEAAYACVSALGELGLVQFKDLNPDVNAFQRKFVNEVRRCDEMERKLRFLQKEILKAGIDIGTSHGSPSAPHPREMIDLEAQFEQLENEMKDSNVNFEAMKKGLLELTELKHILKKTQVFFEEAEHHLYEPQHEGRTDDLANLLDEHQEQPGSQLGFVCGVIDRERVPAFERLLWRACRGNVFFKQAEMEDPMEDPVTGFFIHKCVFIVFFQGEQLKSRVKKICDGFRATMYPCPDTTQERREMALGVITRIEDLQTVLNETEEHRCRLLSTVAKSINNWFIKVRKIKAIYHTMNMFNLDVTHKCLIAECWCPVSDLDQIQDALRRGTEESGASVPSILNRMTTKEDPPTFNRNNKFTEGFQNLVDAYGIANYQEVNPALFTIITFPFLFAVMFGDCGHGLILFVFALWMVLNEKKLAITKPGGEIFETVFSGRYILLLMGAFAIYTGLIYNDCFSKSFDIFGSAWHIDKSHVFNPTYPMLPPNYTDYYRGVPYYFGIDPIWQVAENKISFTNSLKMKMSVILGVSHMLFGICLSCANYKHFQQRINVYALFIPQVLFLLSVFGYLIFLIFYKWIFFNSGSKNAPSLLIILINMFLKISSPTAPEDRLFAAQPVVEKLCAIIAILCIPWMLLSKPLYLWFTRHNIRRQVPQNDESESDENQLVQGDSRGVAISHDSFHNDGDGHVVEHEDEEFEFGEIFIHQVIETIEFCLGCISNTASYLRLWALSLAHAELSEVLWNMVLRVALKFSEVYGFIIIFAVFAMWAALTIAILLVMEGLSAFLHALRLHWVEFMNKFYDGKGYLFVPFSFKSIEMMEDDEVH
ncbi:V-type proton ATPase 116 kDa subunit a1-like isoform X2 [Xenia sp. Carnegie-2017]|uniref:V-type proton ATPase 116 kDa subunit a1-like isoform X2 n=1 Tax=Xenia sp. Carnegie-2017 TaxID=2897299 RepID=UPI001F0481E9|nr:V-type proton ATPase 116 kDa subunit a1-like isoform X2 [Xenia sp. Carnegie-2017]